MGRRKKGFENLWPGVRVYFNAVVEGCIVDECVPAAKVIIHDGPIRSVKKSKKKATPTYQRLIEKGYVVVKGEKRSSFFRTHLNRGPVLRCNVFRRISHAKRIRILQECPTLERMVNRNEIWWPTVGIVEAEDAWQLPA